MSKLVCNNSPQDGQQTSWRVQVNRNWPARTMEISTIGPPTGLLLAGIPTKQKHITARERGIFFCDSLTMILIYLPWNGLISLQLSKQKCLQNSAPESSAFQKSMDLVLRWNTVSQLLYWKIRKYFWILESQEQQSKSNYHAHIIIYLILGFNIFIPKDDFWSNVAIWSMFSIKMPIECTRDWRIYAKP